MWRRWYGVSRNGLVTISFEVECWDLDNIQILATSAVYLRQWCSWLLAGWLAHVLISRPDTIDGDGEPLRPVDCIFVDLLTLLKAASTSRFSHDGLRSHCSHLVFLQGALATNDGWNYASKSLIFQDLTLVGDHFGRVVIVKGCRTVGGPSVHVIKLLISVKFRLEITHRLLRG